MTTKADPHDIFLSAIEFEQATRILGKLPYLVFVGDPFAVLGAFAVELYLKCLLMLDTGASVRGHNLRKLYNSLSPKMKQHVKELYDRRRKGYVAWSPYHAINLDMLLDRCSDVFEVARYRYEKNNSKAASGSWSVIEPLRDAVKIAIWEIKPEWKEHVLPKVIVTL
jgi:hypothetical protein